ncbi:MAG: hypothetical protein U7126_25570 [Microcoleus sp.]
MVRNPVSDSPQTNSKNSKKPGFCENLPILTEILLRNPVSDSPRDRPKIQETGFLREFIHPHRDFGRNPVSDSPQTNSKNSKKPGFCENLRILTEILEETRFLTPHRQTPKTPRNRVSARIYPSSPRFW